MKRRVIYGAAGILLLLMLSNCHWVMPPLRRADAVITVQTTGYCACMECSGWRFNWLGFPVSQNGKMKIVGQTASTRMARPGPLPLTRLSFRPAPNFTFPATAGGMAKISAAESKGFTSASTSVSTVRLKTGV